MTDQKGYSLKPPSETKTMNFMHSTPYENVHVRDGVARVKMRFTRDALLRQGWTEVKGKSAPKPKPSPFPPDTQSAPAPAKRSLKDLFKRKKK
jgi:hypothetical protein